MSFTPSKPIKRVTVHTLEELKQRGEKISMLTAYDYSLAKIVDDANIDVILVGDSASNVMAGHETTLPITLGIVIITSISVQPPFIFSINLIQNHPEKQHFQQNNYQF